MLPLQLLQRRKEKRDGTFAGVTSEIVRPQSKPVSLKCHAGNGLHELKFEAKVQSALGILHSFHSRGAARLHIHFLSVHGVLLRLVSHPEHLL